MMPQLHDNLAAWAVQVLLMGSLGALLPLVFRLRHPRTQLAYNHLVLAACLVLPLIQPWHPSIISRTAPGSAQTGLPVKWIALES
jgi:hypothetical protein